MASSTEDQIKGEIERLTASINQAKFGYQPPQGAPRYGARSNTYVNPHYKPPSSNKYVRPGLKTTPAPRPSTSKPISAINPAPPAPSAEVKEVVLGGVAFESSGRSLVRKDREFQRSSSVGSNFWDGCPYRCNPYHLVVPKKPVTSGPPKPVSKPRQPPPFVRKGGHLIPPGRSYKSKARRGGRNMTLDNTRRPYQSRRTSSKRLKYSDKPCPRFTTTGACSRGLTCMYQHDPSKIAICWNFLQGQCPNTAETCALSHDPTPERTPLCLHFLNKGRCTRDNCPYPHVNVGARTGVCRDFAVLGYCEKGLDCDKQHVRECPDFAEKGACTTKGCKLPHVIRANRNRKPPAASSSVTTVSSGLSVPPSHDAAVGASTADADIDSSVPPHVSAENAKLGDEYISLTFNESESSEDESEDEDDEEEEGDDAEEDAEEGIDDPNDDDDGDEDIHE
ncbi:hypothetical protein BDQ12DRAFT_734584 [Crucibulum laeve]|uniref:C3H1-type domain-containing protein n=1 Tax=Crucibulum laeve TaxID=68775 RepID=A0A5C3M655_9AGAR|nr:hypothetical protein BDQ12DRAFT_734584 [Crucibulum laeve]